MVIFPVTVILFVIPHLIIADNLPIVINTWGFIDAANAAWRALHRPDKSALDALVEGCSTCERLQCDGTVGYGGSPDEHGETTLDAMVMDGATMNIGAVAALRQIKDAIKVARHVLENTQHTLLVGDQARQFAEMMGFKRESLVTPVSKGIWKRWWDDGCQPNFWVNVKPDPRTTCGPYQVGYKYSPVDSDEKEKFGFGPKNHDTIGMIVIDWDGHIFAGTSTNGATHKIPGRVGDSPIPGAGAYADNEVGAAAATGDGDIMMRFLPSFVAVENLRAGQDPKTAAEGALQRILKFHPKFMGGLIVVDRFGNFGAACTGIKRFPFSVAFGNHTEPTAQYIDYLSWLPQRKALIDIFKVAFGKSEYLAVETSLEAKFYQNVVSTETKGLQEIFKNNASRMIEPLELDGEQCFVVYNGDVGVVTVHCVEINAKELQFVQKNQIKRHGVIQIVSLEKNYIATLLADSVEIWKPNKPEKPIQKISAVNPSQIAAVVTQDSHKYIAICSKIEPKSFHHGSVDIYRSTENTPFELMQTIDIVSPLQVEFALLPETQDILLNILTESFDEPLSIYQYKGIVGFQPIVGSSTIPPGSSSLSIIRLQASQQHLFAVMSKDDITLIEMVLSKT